MPKKAFYRARAHVNPLSHNNAFEYPVSPGDFDWSALFQGAVAAGAKAAEPTIIDVGCGFGGLTVALANLFPDECSLAMEIRAKVCEYVRLRIEALRVQEAGKYQNVASLRANCMRLARTLLAKYRLHRQMNRLHWRRWK